MKREIENSENGDVHNGPAHRTQSCCEQIVMVLDDVHCVLSAQMTGDTLTFVIKDGTPTRWHLKDSYRAFM